MTRADWPISTHRGAARAFHDLAMPDPIRPELWAFEVDRPALVLGSTQRPEVVDADAVRAAGVDVARRRSGGGAVLLEPGEVTWVDVLVPVDDPHWQLDVGRSFHWLGDAWATVLDGLGHSGAEVHRGPLVRSAWSDLVCFAGLGPGEVRVGGRKVVGMSQRRTRAGARFQCALLHRWEARSIVDLLALADADRNRAVVDLADVAVGVGPIDPADVVDRLRSVLVATTT